MELQKKETVRQPIIYALLIKGEVAGRKILHVQLFQLGYQVEIAKAFPFCTTRRR